MTKVPAFLAILTIAIAPAAPVSAQRPSPVIVTVSAPDAEQFEVALDEIELRWRGASAGAGAVTPRLVTRTTVRTAAAGRAELAVAGAFSLGDMQATLREVQAANQGASAHLVLYEAGKVRTPATRRLLGREVAALVEPHLDGALVLSGGGAREIRPLAAVPGGFVVVAEDPVATIELARLLAQLPGVRTAYPLLARQQFTR